MITIKQLDNQLDIDNASALLYDVYVDHLKWDFSPNNPAHLRIDTRNNKKVLLDKMTNDAVWFGAFEEDVLVGCIRITNVDKYNRFDFEYYPSSQTVTQYMPPNKGMCVCVSKLAVQVAYPDKAFIIQNLFLKVFKYCLSKQYSIIAVTREVYLKSLFTIINFPLMVEHAFKFEEIDPMPVNFYRAYFENGELAVILNKLESLIKLSKQYDRPSITKIVK